jgi:hypothetical protein
VQAYFPLENILMSDSGVMIINFSHSEQCDDQQATDKEYTQLGFLLGCQ